MYALMQLGLDVPSSVIHELFEEWDSDGSESINLRELAITLNSKSIVKPLSHVVRQPPIKLEPYACYPC